MISASFATLSWIVVSLLMSLSCSCCVVSLPLVTCSPRLPCCCLFFHLYASLFPLVAYFRWWYTHKNKLMMMDFVLLLFSLLLHFDSLHLHRQYLTCYQLLFKCYFLCIFFLKKYRCDIILRNIRMYVVFTKCVGGIQPIYMRVSIYFLTDYVIYLHEYSLPFTLTFAFSIFVDFFLTVYFCSVYICVRDDI